MSVHECRGGLSHGRASGQAYNRFHPADHSCGTAAFSPHLTLTLKPRSSASQDEPVLVGEGTGVHRVADGRGGNFRPTVGLVLRAFIPIRGRSLQMTKLLVLAAAVLMLAGLASAQDKSQKSMTNCPPLSSDATTSNQKGQAVEKSAILPSAGGEAGTSAASTVQGNGKSVEARTDCPQETNTPKG